MLDGERKSIQPLAQRVNVPGWHGDTMQALQQFVNQSPWEEQAVLRTYRRLLAASLAEAAGVIVIDDTGFAKKGRHSAGVARQYSGTLGKTDNCQVAVSLHYAAPRGDYPLALRLFLRERWTSQPERMQAVRVPAETHVPCTKGEIALDLLDQVRAEGLAHQAVVADAGYGLSVDFRRGLEDRHEQYVVGIAGKEAVFSEPPAWAVGPDTQRGRPPTRRYVAADTPQPVAVKQLAEHLERTPLSWRQGTKGPLHAEFAWVRVWPAHRWQHGRAADDLPDLESEARWLLVEWRTDSSIRYALSNLPAETPLVHAVELWKSRWHVEQGYHNSKRSWAWTTSRDAPGLASTTTPPCASWRMASWPWSDCVARPPRWMTWWSRRPPALSEHRPGSGGTAASLHAAGGSPRPAMLAGLPMALRPARGARER